VMGSPLYMSPEQLISAKDVDARSDVWALGVILYELIAAKPPFDGATVAELVTRILHAPHASLTEARPDVPPALDAAISRCLAKDPAQRFPDVSAFARAIAAHAPTKLADISLERISRLSGEHEPVDHQRIALARTAPMGSIEPATNAWGATNLETPRKSSTGLIIGAVAIVGLLAGGTYFMTRTPEPPVIKATTSPNVNEPEPVNATQAMSPGAGTGTGTGTGTATATATATGTAPATVTAKPKLVLSAKPTASAVPVVIAKPTVTATATATPTPTATNPLKDMEPK
jgi:serine/threonine protein kinase